MNRTITNDQIENVEMYLDERLEIFKSVTANPTDKVYYDGLIKAISLFGFDYMIRNGKHVLFR